MNDTQTTSHRPLPIAGLFHLLTTNCFGLYSLITFLNRILWTFVCLFSSDEAQQKELQNRDCPQQPFPGFPNWGDEKQLC